jgi:hypothetical protein
MSKAVASFNQAPGERFMDRAQSGCNMTKILADMERKTEWLEPWLLSGNLARDMPQSG